MGPAFRRDDNRGKPGLDFAEAGALIFFCSVLIEGVLAGAIYALIALAFVLVYKSSRMINFAVGEWIMCGALLAGFGQSALRLDAAGATLFASIAMVTVGLVFNAIVV